MKRFGTTGTEPILLLLLFLALGAFCEEVLSADKGEKEVRFVQARPDLVMGDWQGTGNVAAAQVVALGNGKYQALLLSAFDKESNLVASLQGTATNGGVLFIGDGWTASINNSRFVGDKDGGKFELRHIVRTSPTIGAKPPASAIVLFDGTNLDAWAKKSGKDWLAEDGPPKWKLVEGGAMEVVPGADCLISHRTFGDCHLHAEFRTLGTPSNSGIFFQDRYELNINETYGQTAGTPNAGFDNCTEDVRPRVRPCFPPLSWQTFDVDFRAPRFDATGRKTQDASATVQFNGVKIYDQQRLDIPHGAARRLGEAAKGPLMLQEHGMPLQFRNIWVVEIQHVLKDH